MKTSLNPIPIRKTGHDTEVTRRAYAMLQRFIPFITDTYKTWDRRPDCGYVLTGCHWYGADQNEAAALLAFLSRFGTVDPALTGQTNEEMRAMAIRILRYACFTHDTGPEDCVRVDGKNRQQANTKWGGNVTTWGERRLKFFQSSQVGSGMVYFGLAAWFLWEHLDEETQEMCRQVLIYYAERFAEMEPRDGTYYNTQSEENGWTANGISIAAILFADDPRAQGWRDGATRWMLDGALTPQDMFSSEIIVDGQNVRPYMDHITFHPDFTTENHGRVHPDYMAAFMQQRMAIALFSLLGEQPLLPGTRHNWQEIFDRTFKLWATPDGYAVPVQSQDWWYFRTFLGACAATSLLFDDPDAAYMERCSLSTLEKTQQGHSRHTFISNEPEQCIISAQFQDLSDMESGYGSQLMKAFLLHYCLGEGPVPSDAATFERNVGRIRNYPNGGVIVARKPDTFSAFAYRNACLAIVTPQDKTWTITTPPASTFGELVFTEPPANRGLANESMIRDMIEPRIFAQADSYAGTGVIDRGHGRMEQAVAFITLDDGRAVYFEHVTAKADFKAESFTSGLIGVRNERYEHLRDWAPGERKLYINDEAPQVMPGYIGEADELFNFHPVRYAALDDKMAYLLDGSVGVRYVGHHVYPKWKGIEDFLILNNRDAFAMTAGERFPRFTMVFLPGAGIAQAKEAYATFHVAAEGDCDAVILGDRLIYASLHDQQHKVQATFRWTGDRVPLFEGVCAWDGTQYTWMTRLGAREAGSRRLIDWVAADKPFKVAVLPDHKVVAITD